VVTKSTDLTFEPKIWQDHIEAYFDQKLVYGAFAYVPEGEYIPHSLKEGGETVNFPYFNKINGAEKPNEDENLVVDKLTDGNFTAVVAEYGKAVGWTKTAVRKSTQSRDRIYREAKSQIARVLAERLDNDLRDETNTAGNFEQGFLATAAADTMNVKRLMTGQVKAFGDKADDAEVTFMHSFQYLDYVTDAGTGFIKADASDPFYFVNGFKGRVNQGLVIIVNDNVTKVADIDGKAAYRAMIHKPNSYGFMPAEEMMFDEDNDALARQEYVVATQWYAVKSFHKKKSTDYKTAAAVTTTVSI